MNHRVPELDADEFYSAPSSSQSRQKNMQENDIMELVWHNGQLGVQNQNKKLFRKPSPLSKSQQHHQPPSHPIEQPPPPPESASTTELFMQEDEMTSWLHYPIDDETSFDQHLTDLLYHPPGPSAAPPSSSARVLPPADLRPPLPPQPHHQYLPHQSRPQSRPPAHPSAVGINFPQFARLKSSVPESGQSASSRNNELRVSTVVDSSDTPKSSLFPVSRSAVNVSGGESTSDSGAIAGMSTAGCSGGYMTMSKDADTHGGSVSGGSATATADLMARPPADDRKRKGIEAAGAFTTEYPSEDLEIESCEAKKQCRGTASGKRSRAAEVHNLSERKRRDRINEKLKALQELIPRCSKTDKASMLDEAIDYLKSLQMQVQMMSMGYYGLVPMMFPGVQQYMPVPPMGLGMGMGMETRMNRPMVPFPSVLAGSSMPTPVAPSSMGPRFQFPTPPVPTFDPSRVQSNPMEPLFNPHEPCAILYQQYLGAQQMPLQQISQNPPISMPSTSKPSTSIDAEDNDKHPSGNAGMIICNLNIYRNDQSVSKLPRLLQVKDFPGWTTQGKDN